MDKKFQKLLEIYIKIIRNDDSKQFFYYGLVLNALHDKIITYDDYLLIKQHLHDLGYFDTVPEYKGE